MVWPPVVHAEDTGFLIPACCLDLPPDTGLQFNRVDTVRDNSGAILTAPTVVYAVRHAEKDVGEDPSLTEEGRERALALADRMDGVPLAAIYATDLRRTQETVAPTAERHNLPVRTDLDPGEELADTIRLLNRGQTVLHAGHSYTLGGFMDALGVQDLPDSYDYGDLWIITLNPNGEVAIEESHYGA